VLEGNYCDKLRQIGAIGLAGPGDEKWYLPDFCIVPISEKYYSDTVDIVPIIGYTTV